MIINAPLVIDGKTIAGEALTIIAALMERLQASVALQDLQRREAHIRMSDTWLCNPTAPEEIPIGMRDPDDEQLSAPVNWRWKLWAAPSTHFSGDAFHEVLRAARSLAAFLPAEELPEGPTPADGGAGGSSGPAELGIPVAWARKTRG